MKNILVNVIVEKTEKKYIDVTNKEYEILCNGTADEALEIEDRILDRIIEMYNKVDPYYSEVVEIEVPCEY